MSHPLVMLVLMIFTTRCAGCDAPGAPICRTCRFALISRADAGGPEGVIIAAPFSGRVRDVLLGFKYRNRRAIAGHLAGLLVNRIAAAGQRVDAVTWAPTSSRRRRERGFDQAELVARRVARQLGVPCRRLLERGGGEEPQTGRGRVARLHAPVFRAHPRVPAGRILLIDDVVTTGATLRTAAACLRRAGATGVVPAAFAATPGRAVELQRVA